ncbi:dihydropteridine reductase-like [Babylonia areolata]|uniref:dihydropteridine reductase-like n=1 Tax=Babylonia areolata TaxID=304850 RepID=UPI003FD49FEA
MAAGRVLVYGGKGALGSTCVKFFKTKDYWVGSIGHSNNDDADANFLVTTGSLTDQEEEVTSQVAETLGELKLDAIFCVAGGWAGGNAASKKLTESADTMWKQSVWPSVIASRLAALHLKNGGLLALTGAQPSLAGTPGMIGYGLAKAAVHQLTQSLGGQKSGMPPDSVALAILPETLDTPMNRKWMAKADFSTWTSLEFVAELFEKWTCGHDRPVNGSLVKLVTRDSQTQFVVV